MAVFRAYNAAGTGFDMSSTGSSGWAFIGARPSVRTALVYDNGRVAGYEVYGSSQVDYFTTSYWSNGYDIVIDDLLYERDGYRILSIQNLDLYTTAYELDAYAWYVTINRGHDDFYGNDYEDLIRAGAGNDIVCSYDDDDIVYGDSGHDSLYGGQGHDDLYGGTGRDVLNGSSGSDYLSGGGENDVLTGGSGRDYFVFATRASSGNVDRITDFRPVDDTIMLDNRMFTRVGRDGWLTSSAFNTGSSAKDASDRIIYNKKTGALLYDPDGIGGAAAVKLAQLSSALEITRSDFFVL
jgi:Ca2+-binding RTX toxin-like protein